MWFFFALAFALISSVGVIIAKKVMQSTDEFFFLFASGIFALPFLIFIILVFYQVPQVDVVFVRSVVISSILGVSGGILAYKAIKIADISLVAPLAAFNPVFTAVLSLIFLGESLEVKGWFGIFLVVLGAYMLQLSKTRKGIFGPLKAMSSNKAVQFSIAAYLIWSISPIFEKTAILHTFPLTPPFIGLASMAITIPTYAILVSKFSKRKNILEGIKKNFTLLLLTGVLGGAGIVAAYTAFSLTNVGFATAVFKTSVLFTVVLGWIFFKEKDIKSRLLGSLVMLAGVFLLVS